MATREKIKLTSYDELLGVPSDGAKEVEINRIHSFKNHPFKVKDDESMDELVESIKSNDVLSPILLREDDNGGYELISGHRRKRACELAGLEKVPAIVKELSDDEAIVLMVDSNIQRDEILPSEKAYAYRMKLEALSHQGKLNTDMKTSAESIGEKEGISERQVQRYVRLTYLIPEILDLVDEKKLSMVMAVEISYLNEDVQQTIYDKIVEGKKISPGNLKELKKKDDISAEDIEDLIFTSKQEKVRTVCKVTLKENKLAQFFEPTYTKQEMEEIIYSLLEEWKKGKN